MPGATTPAECRFLLTEVPERTDSVNGAAAIPEASNMVPVCVAAVTAAARPGISMALGWK